MKIEVNGGKIDGSQQRRSFTVSQTKRWVNGEHRKPAIPQFTLNAKN
jgi:hypothetical protein